MNQTVKPPKKESVAAGVIGAFIFPIVFAALWFFLYLRQHGADSIWLALLVVYASCKGYALLSHAPFSKKSAWIGLVFGNMWVFVTHFVTYYIFLLGHLILIEPETDPTSVFVSFFSYLNERNQTSEFWTRYGIAVFAGLLGFAFYYYRAFLGKAAKKRKEEAVRDEEARLEKIEQEIPSPEWLFQKESLNPTPYKDHRIISNDISDSLYGSEDESSD